jgi:cobalt-zinc-cadmium efflux system outer membrane protein
MLLVSGFIAVLSSTPVLADEQALSLTQVIEYSLRNNGDLKALREEKGIREAAKVRAGLLPNPTLDLEADTGALTGSKEDKSQSIGLSQEFLLAGKRNKRLTVAERELDIYRWQVANRERLLRHEVQTAFFDTLLAQERAALAERSIGVNRQLLEVTQERLKAGDIPELEMNLVKVELARSEGARIESARAMRQSQSRLWALMGLPAVNQPAIVGKLESGFSMKKNLAELKQLAQVKRPDLKALYAEKSRGDADIVLAEAEKVPNLTVGVVYTHDQGTDKTATGEEKVRDNLLGVRLSIPIPLFDRNQAGVQDAHAKRNSSESRLVATAEIVEREVETAYAGFQNAASVLSLYKSDIIPQLEENLKLTQEAYRLGEVGILSVIQEQKKFFEVSEGYLVALHDRQTALAGLESAVASELIGGEK